MVTGPNARGDLKRERCEYCVLEEETEAQLSRGHRKGENIPLMSASFGSDAEQSNEQGTVRLKGNNSSTPLSQQHVARANGQSSE